jgi:hypothetical protein
MIVCAILESTAKRVWDHKDTKPRSFHYYIVLAPLCLRGEQAFFSRVIL